jgi:ribosome recycling factor
MLDAILKEAEEKMKKALQVVDHELGGLRTGRASTQLVDRIRVQVYGQESPLAQVATLSTPDASTIMIQPWDKGVLPAIEKAILQANIGLTPNNDGKVIRLNIPALTQDTRKEMVKKAHGIAEEGRVAVRNIRRHSLDEIKKKEKDKAVSEDDSKKSQEVLQKKTDEYIKKIDATVAAMEKEIMTV